ncbi:MAG: BT_3928 family protein [Flavobacterium sp.]
MKYIITLFRILVGGLFIFSGAVKLIDPIGFSYKLKDYFAENVLDIPSLIPFVLQISIFFVILEIILGVMLLLGYKNKFTVWSLWLMILFFTFLTFYAAYYDKVKDCGCFGDFLKLKPWHSFYKDLILTIMILFLLIGKKYIQPFLTHRINLVITLLSLASCCFFTYYTLSHNPVIDFRPYKIGNNIIEGMNIPEDAPKPVTEMVYLYKVNGKVTEFSMDQIMKGDFPKDEKDFVDRIDKVIVEGYVPPIKDFTMEKDGIDQKYSLLKEPKLLIFTMYDITIADEEGLEKLENLHQKALKKGYKVIGLTGSDEPNYQKRKKELGHTFDYYFCDGTALKTIERSNPSIIVVNKAVIKDKKHWNDIDEVKL